MERLIGSRVGWEGRWRTLIGGRRPDYRVVCSEGLLLVFNEAWDLVATVRSELEAQEFVAGLGDG